MELNEPPVDGGDCWILPAVRENALDTRNLCHSSALQSRLQFESCEKSQEILL